MEKTSKPSISYPGLQTQFSSYWVEDGSYLRIAERSFRYIPFRLTALVSYLSLLFGFIVMWIIYMCLPSIWVMILKTVSLTMLLIQGMIMVHIHFPEQSLLVSKSDFRKI